MPPPGRRKKAERAGYHHGNLRAALIDTAIDLLGERGIQGFSLAEASRRLGVAVAAPYRHFADRDELLVAVAVRASEALGERLEQAADPTDPPERRLTDLVRTYVGFAYDNQPLFQALFAAGLDKSRRPELERATRRVAAIFFGPALTICDGDENAATGLTGAIGAAAHGHAMLLLDGGFGSGEPAIELAATHAARTTLALIGGRDAFRTSSGNLR